MNTAAIKKLCDDLVPIEKRIAQARADRKALRKAFAADTGMALSDYDAAVRLADIEDDDARHSKIDNMMAVYNTLKPGEQLNWLDAA